MKPRADLTNLSVDDLLARRVTCLAAIDYCNRRLPSNENLDADHVAIEEMEGLGLDELWEGDLRALRLFERNLGDVEAQLVNLASQGDRAAGRWVIRELERLEPPPFRIPMSEEQLERMLDERGQQP